MQTHPDLWMTMIETADIVAERYNVSREAQDEYALQSQQRMAAAQAADLFKDEIVPLETKMKVINKETGEESIVDTVVDRDDCNRPDTTLEGLASLKPVRGEDKFITAILRFCFSDRIYHVPHCLARTANRPQYRKHYSSGSQYWLQPPPYRASGFRF